MRAYIGYSTSTLYWLKHGTDVPCYLRVAHVSKLANAAVTLSELMSLDLGSLGLDASQDKGWPDYKRKGFSAKKPIPIGSAFHVLVPEGADRNRIEGFNRHCWSSRIPSGSFCKLAPDVYLSTPEFSFLQLAGVLTMQQLVLVGYWLCAVYRLQEGAPSLPCDPVTTVEALREYLDGAAGCYGANKARRALRWIVGGARSPMEVNVTVLASLPIRLGGYGFRVPRINYKLDAKDFKRELLDRDDRQYFEIDLYWKNKRVGIEYDGATHYEREQVRKDKRRLNALLAHGERILVVMYDQLADKDVREALMNQLAELLNVHRKEATDKELETRTALDSMLFGNEFAL